MAKVALLLQMAAKIPLRRHRQFPFLDIKDLSALCSNTHAAVSILTHICSPTLVSASAEKEPQNETAFSIFKSNCSPQKPYHLIYPQQDTGAPCFPSYYERDFFNGCLCWVKSIILKSFLISHVVLLDPPSPSSENSSCTPTSLSKTHVLFLCNFICKYACMYPRTCG